ncbi:C-type lectin domain family 10 member A-like [Mya arenaria]|uniref:C-type lectin domain family 10 member A-like n=1 Tax=Mya arenaria TaxID=6604 RepID=UPI0022E750D9|nr:C-type lectin domain family 10 member A-like [Mya arenaria]XP_052764066.1 C-type lectin domain family 10 member A-like [Mya arenaria]
MTAFIGRKRLMSTLYIQGHCLVQCCDQDLCNVGCNQTSLTVTSAPIQTPHPSPTKDTSSQVTATTPNIKIPTKPSTTLSTDVPTTSGCGDRLESYQTSCYIFSHREMSFDSAKAFCAHQRAYLVRVDTAGENMFLTNKIKLLNKGWVQYWLGINVSGGVWYYTGTNVTSTFAEWAPHEPDGKHTLDGDDNIANCAVMSPYVGFKWRDEGCSPYEMAETICEMRNPSLP